MRLALASLSLVIVCASACDRTDADEGRDASLQVAGAQFFREALPADESGPRVRALTIGSTFVAGDVDRSCSGDLEPRAVAVAIGLTGDLGYWIVRAEPPTAASEASPAYAALLSFSPKMRPGPRQLVVRAVDAERRFGPPETRTLTIAERAAAEGRLVVSLSWNNSADLDLHVVDPRGVEIFKRNPSSYEPPPPGSPPDSSDAAAEAGILDFDSNGECVPDGRRAENVAWRAAPPKGHYLVRVDTFSLCGQPSAFWRAEVRLEGTRIAAAEGTSTEEDERFPHNRGDGLLAVEFDVP